MKKGIFNSIRKVLLGAFLSCSLLAGANTAHAALGIDFSGYGGFLTNGGPTSLTGNPSATGFSIVGWAFKPTIDLYVTRLGVFDADKDRLHSEAHLVGIWNASSPLSPLTSVTINEVANNTPDTTPMGAKFHFETAPGQVLLKAGQTYVVGATMYAGTVSTPGSTSDFDHFASFNNGDTTVSVNPYLTYLGSAYAINGTNSLAMPTTAYITDYTIGANLEFTPTPVPAAAWLLGSGLLGLVGIRRRKM
jgi:hypothetical protein